MRKLFILVLLSIAFGNMGAQGFAWANRGGLYRYDYGYGIVTDTSGNIYVAGKYEDTADFNGATLPCAGNHDAFLAKYNSSGSLVWINTAGGPLGDYAHTLAGDGKDFLYMAGEIEGFGNIITFPGSTITLNTLGYNDIFLTKYDLNGNLIWARSAGGPNNEEALGITYDNAGNVFICGFYSVATTFDGITTLNGNGAQDIYIAKYDMNGNFQWVQTAGGAGRDEAKSIKCDADGNVYVCGLYSNGAVFGTNTLSSPNGYYESFIAKYTNNGALEWVRTGGGDYDDVAWCLTVDNANLIYVTGEFNASAYFGSTQLITSGNADVFVTCYDGSGNVQWVKRAGGPLIDRARGINFCGAKLYITGQFGAIAQFGTSEVIAADSSDVFMATLTNTGSFISAISVAGLPDALETLGYESGISICAEASGNIYATGGLLDGGVFGDTTIAPYSRTDVFVTKLSPLVNAIPVNSSANKNIQIYPNPGNGVFIIDMEQRTNQKVDIKIYNCLGQVIDKKSNKFSSKINIDLSKEANGIYFMEIKSEDNTTITKKIVVQK